MNVCWKCGNEIGIYFNLWWECARVQNFWKLITKELRDIFDRDTKLNPEMALLAIFVTEDYDFTTREFLTNLLFAVKLIIARNWKSKLEFQLEEWYNEIWNLAINDKLTCILKVKKGK